ncbi:DNA (cytosine-5-)-methyltransferase [Clostridium botulinum]|nr:DNA (cytosine-5-)-methyltransferase [Clostridium botulinum]
MLSIISIYLEKKVPIDKNLRKFMDYYRKKEMMKYLKDNNSPTVADFFCGAGGMSLGFYQSGYKIVFANDIEKVCTETYSFNHYEIPKDRIINDDIINIVNNIDNIISEKVNIVIGGPPCQGFSMANRQRIIDDPRNVLYRYYVKGIEKLKPEFFIMENVKGMLSVAEQVREDFHNLQNVDYNVAYYLFNARNFSVPQNRERLIYIGVRNDISQKINRNATQIIEEIIEQTEQMRQYVLYDAIADLRKLEAFRTKNATEIDTEKSGKKIERNTSREASEYVNLINNNGANSLIFNHKARYNNDRDIEIFGRMLPGDKSDSLRIADIMPYTSRNNIFKDKYYKLIFEEPCKTITAHMKFDCNMYIHPNQARGLTPREAARLQSYPDNYFFRGSYTKTYMQIGNSVPPLMANLFAKVIKKYL